MYLLPGNLVNRAAPLNRGMVIWWLHLPNRLTGGGNTLRDIWGLNHGTLTNGPTWSGPIGRPAYGSLGFSSASSQSVKVPNSAAITAGDIDILFSACVILTAKGHNRAIIWKGDPSNGEYLLQYQTGADRFALRVWGGAAFANAGGVTADTLGSPTIGQPYFVRGWHDSASLRPGICRLGE